MNLLPEFWASALARAFFLNVLCAGGVGLFFSARCYSTELEVRALEDKAKKEVLKQLNPFAEFAKALADRDPTLFLIPAKTYERTPEILLKPPPGQPAVLLLESRVSRGFLWFVKTTKPSDESLDIRVPLILVDIAGASFRSDLGKGGVAGFEAFFIMKPGSAELEFYLAQDKTEPSSHKLKVRLEPVR